MKNNPLVYQVHIAPFEESKHVPHGWGNGYVRVPEEHRLWHATDREMAEALDVHGGITWDENKLPDLEENTGRWVGFDTAHSSYDRKLDKAFVVKETLKMLEQMMILEEPPV